MDVEPVTPSDQIRRPSKIMFKSFEELVDKVETTERTLVVAAAHESHTLEAVYMAAEELKVKYILVGDRERILSLSSELGRSPDANAVVDAGSDVECVDKAADLIRDGSGDALMKGLIDTKTLLKAVLDKESGIRGSGTLTHLAILESPAYHKLIGITDGGMIPNPTLEQKADIARNAAAYFRHIGYELPKIAALCASEVVSEKIQETVDAAALQDMCRNEKLGDCLLEGPLSFDIAVSKESASIKGFFTDVSGDADVLLVPSFTVGNVLAKGLVYWAGAKMAGCILGAKTPIVLTSRGASSEEKLLSIMMSIL